MWFDGQANAFDDSAGLDPAVGRRVAEAIAERCGDGVILDIGAGTGSIGCHFLNLPQRYVALDLSHSMLAIFRGKLQPMPPNFLLAEADCNRVWPIDSQSVNVIFASRVVHHLNISHFVAETDRVRVTGGALLLGRVKRDPDSLASRLQRYKRLLLPVGGGEQSIRQVVETCVALGAKPLPPATVVRWTRRTTARQLLASWEAKPHLTSSAAGKGMTAEQRAATIDELTRWARDELGDLDRAHEFTEDYVLQGATWNPIS